jgi:hypothetical protein
MMMFVFCHENNQYFAQTKKKQRFLLGYECKMYKFFFLQGNRNYGKNVYDSKKKKETKD